MQLRRGSMNSALKIAEGCGQEAPSEFVRCLLHARGVGVELEYLLLLGSDLQLIKAFDYEVLLDQVVRVRKMLSGLIKTLQAQPV
jgi:four helix bundle protein